MFNVLIIDEIGNVKVIPFVTPYEKDAEYPAGLGDFIATHIHPCSGCGTSVLYDESVNTEDDGWCCKTCATQ